ncbi:MAG TPA: DegQ family serine endoprotease [Candidatus Limnocylindria bacterium]|nr:DegQ family serine endoprotease [Candidatus Limnocylindria bacterium]
MRNETFSLKSRKILSAVASASLLLGSLEFAHAAGKTIPSITLDSKPINRDSRLSASFSPIVKKVGASVVKVDTAATVKMARGGGNLAMENPFLRRFFGEEGPEGVNPRMPRQHGVGSGVLVTADGYILTNNHVVEGADEVKITLTDGREFTAKVIGTDPKSDVAVVKVEGSGLPHVSLADSDQIEVGDTVLAIGNPFALGQTVTSGIVSATSRGALGLDYEDFIQTDAAINPGNSGGALVDAEGRLIGINTAILSRTGGNQGIGFAIPVNLAKGIMEQLVEDGKVTRGYLGVAIQDVTPGLARKLDLKDARGALISDVSPKGPAAKAGLESGDVVLSFDGKKVESARHLKLAVARTKPGESVGVKVLRDGDEKSLKVTVKELQDKDEIAKSDSSSGDADDVLNGVGVGDLDARTRRQFGIPEKIDGVVVTEVAPDSPAREQGLQAGDVILEMNRKPVKSAEEAVRMSEHSKDRITLLKVWSRGNSHFLVIDESKK